MWTYHFAWNDDATEIVGITSVGRATILALKMNRLQLIRVRKMWVRMGDHPSNI
ncbi:MAG: hypothetical protein V7L31_20000 [Nostoc sp.]|uniref:hypothetical protein n=1 Tax=Nostoc sp. TaxID=1180 RepID=UPI002FF04746